MSAADLLIPVLVFAALGCGLMAGLFFVFSNAVMPALVRIPAPSAVAAMQAVNITIVNPLFLLFFVGTAAACGFLLVGGFLGWYPSRPELVAGTLLYLVGAFGVTAAVNVPLNNALERLDATGAEAAAFWPDYAARWIRWNHVRTITSLAAAACLTFALYRLGSVGV